MNHFIEPAAGHSSDSTHADSEDYPHFKQVFNTVNAVTLVGAVGAGLMGYRLAKKEKKSVRIPPRATHASASQRVQQPMVKEQNFVDLLKMALPLIVSYQARSLKQQWQDAPAPVIETAKEIAPEFSTIARGSRAQQAWHLSKAAINAWIDDFAPSMGAAIAYYTIFSIAPMLVIAIAVAGLIFGQEAAQGEIVSQLRGLIGTDGAVAVQGLLKSASEPTSGIIATGLSIVTLVIGATAVFAELQSALDRIWRVPAAVKESGIWALIRTRFLSFGLVLGLGFILMVSLVVSAGLSALGNWWSGWFAGWEIILQVLNFVVSFVVFTSLFGVIYKFMPRVRLSWHDVWIGAVATTLLFTIGKFLIGLYLGKAGMTSGFGAAGSFALLLAWIYYSAQIFLLGAEFTWIYANNFGSRAMKPSAQKPLVPLTLNATCQPKLNCRISIRSGR
jgi:YihY family inner membrane protein